MGPLSGPPHQFPSPFHTQMNALKPLHSAEEPEIVRKVWFGPAPRKEMLLTPTVTPARLKLPDGILTTCPLEAELTALVIVVAVTVPPEQVPFDCAVPQSVLQAVVVQ